MTLLNKILQSFLRMIWWTKKTEWQVTPERVWVSTRSGPRIFARARCSGIEVGDAYVVRMWEFEAVENDSVPKRIREILVKQLTELYLKQYPDEPAHREYDEYDQADDCEDSLEISRRLDADTGVSRVRRFPGWAHLLLP